MLSALNATRERHQTTREALRPGTCIIAGITYHAGITLHGIKPELSPDGGGAIYVQRGEMAIRKSLLPTCPPRGTVVSIGGVEYTISDNGGQLEHSIAWILQLMRLPPKV